MVKPPALSKTRTIVNDDSLVLLQNQVNDLNNKWCRALADYQNLEKRTKTEKELLTKFLNADLIEKLLVIVDDLERASAHFKDKGIEMILDKFRKILTSEGVEEMNVLGKPFDPELMNCAEMVEGKPNLVVEITEKGYLLHGRLLRPAKVKVGKGGPPSPKASEGL